jgi:sugar phosphate permease
MVKKGSNHLGKIKNVSEIHKSIADEIKSKPIKINILTVILLPNVAIFACTNMCVKSAEYGLLFWLPKFLNEKGLKGVSAYISTVFDLANFIGGILLGIASDVYRKRGIIICPSLYVSALCMAVIILFLDKEAGLYFLMIFLVGFTIGGPCKILFIDIYFKKFIKKVNLISSCVAIDLAK